ncbi:VOC family protein [Nocardioides lijunqiniae]|uniref:VOC family protein n=1 Tax=Nocardioides lijunqiniae TaxID=2760832 RepID=UPI001877D9C4|nr:VOC family protein [Nocardioides lijunqiniae]
MTTRLSPYLHFNGGARAAITFYESVFGGELLVNTFGEMGMEGEQADKIMHSQLETPHGLVLMAGDTPPDVTVSASDTVTLCLSGDDEAQLTAWFAALSEGGEIQVPLERQMWGDVFGQCADQHGVSWMVNIVPQP